MLTTASIDILDCSLEQLRKIFVEAKLEAFRANQVFNWIYTKRVYDFGHMSDLPAALRHDLRGRFRVGLPRVSARERSGEDGSVKLLLELAAGGFVETVFIPRRPRRTVCVSSQVGCKFHCAFCASGQAGFARNLTAGEILSQVLLAREESDEKTLTNVVFMGIGEPFDNYAAVLKAVRVLNSPQGLGLGARRITISTCGVVPKIESFGREGLQVELSVSLHGATDAVRGAVMPVNKAYPLAALVPACRRYVEQTKRAITFEYILIRGVNASEKNARDLARLLKHMLCKVNLIPYNPIHEFPHEAPPHREVVRFQQILQSSGILATVRFSKGGDIQAACGQLRAMIGAGKR